MVTRILIGVLVAHAIALPIAARFGAFDKLKREFGTSRVVMINVPEVEEKKKKTPEKPKKAPKTAPSRKAASAAAKSTTSQKSNAPHPNVVATNSPGEGGNGGAVADPGTGVAGVLPTNPNPVTVPAKTPDTAPVPPTPPQPEVKTEVKPNPPVTPVTPVAPVAKRIVQASAEYAPEPEIPDDLRSQPFEKTLLVEADVDTGGHPVNVRVAESTGVKELDDVGLDTARRYRFKPATVNEEPVQEHVRFRIIFKVE